MAHGEDLRIRVVKAIVEDGLSRNEAAKVFRVGVASAIRWVDAYEAEGRTKALPMGGDRRSVFAPCRDWLLSLRREENDLTLDQLCARLWAEHAIKADKSMLSRFFAAEGVSFKKNRARQRAAARRRGRGARSLAKGAA
jgi:putative transposase